MFLERYFVDPGTTSNRFDLLNEHAPFTDSVLNMNQARAALMFTKEIFLVMNKSFF